MLVPGRAGFRPGDVVTVEVVDAPASGRLEVTHFDRVVHEIDVSAGSSVVDLGSFPTGGYGVRLAGSATAFDVLESSWERPRYGFVVSLTAEVDVASVADFARRLHLTASQFYDWAYRHSQLMPPADDYIDPLGQPRSLAVVNAMAMALADVGCVPLGYSAVYAVGHDEIDRWRTSVIRRPDGGPYRLGDNFLVLVDPAEPEWLAHYLDQLESVVAHSALQGFHLDQYGWPKFATRADGVGVDLGASFVTMLEAIRDRLPQAQFMFNNVNDFPTYATAGSPQDATYIEVWAPHSSLGSLGRLATSARAARPEHPPILSAYLSCYADDPSRADAAAALVMATAYSHGATHLLLGEAGHALTGPYYPDNHVLASDSVDFFVRWYDFAVRYGDLFYDETQADVTEFFAGGINEDVVLTEEGVTFSTQAEPGTVWIRVVRTRHGLVVHLIDLTAQNEVEWDAGKEPFTVRRDVRLRLSMVATDAVVTAASVDAPDLVGVPSVGVVAGEQSDALSAGQASVEFVLPPWQTWTFVLIPFPQN